MRSPCLDQTSPAELFSVGRSSFEYVDIPRTTTFLASVSQAPRWSSPWTLGEGFLGPIVAPREASATAVRLNMQDPWPTGPAQAGVVSLDAWNDFPRGPPNMGSSPRQRSGFIRDVYNTPALFVAQSPSVAQAYTPLSPSLPFIAPDAPERTKHLAARTARRKRLFRARRWANSQAAWLVLYFTLNLCLTLYNKGVLVRFPYPYTLTSVHALFGSIGGHMLKKRGAYKPARLTSKGYAVLVAFSVLYSANIAVSNLSLQLVTIPVSLQEFLPHPFVPPRCGDTHGMYMLTRATVSSGRTRRNTYIHHTPFNVDPRRPVQQCEDGHLVNGHARSCPGVSRAFSIISTNCIHPFESEHMAITTSRLSASFSLSLGRSLPHSRQSTPASCNLRCPHRTRLDYRSFRHA